MAVDKIIDRAGAEQVMPTEVSKALLNRIASTSTVLASNVTRVPMSSKQTRLPVANALASVEFVNGDTGLKQTTDFGFGKKELIAEEVAGIVVIPDAVADDADFDLWAYAEDQLVSAVARKVDLSVLFGHDRTTWPEALIPGAEAAAKVVTLGTNSAAKGGIAGDVSDVFSLVEDSGYDATDVFAARSLRGKLRQARNTNGDKLAEITTTEAYGTPIRYGAQGLWTPGAGEAVALVGDMSHVVIGIRQDVTFRMFDSGVISDENGKVVVNLMQQDAKALRVVFRFAYQVDDTVNIENINDEDRYPFAVLKTPAAV